ncbi:tRNA-dihydrouridine synthase DusB [hydrothermal vent metagenome]|uniref:tRNA-dihydrouridine synthase DusB n=1 Tax=hydrothermal vent metagenome TaxID=652676 RepID=A0A3B1BQ49_9ZZZZ
MRIGDVKLKSNVVMAPIAGMTDRPYRKIVLRLGAGMVTSELLSSNAIIRDSAKTLEMLPTGDEPHPVSAQIFGADPCIMRDAALIVEDTPCDIIDLNFGCPAKKVTKNGAGAALLKNMDNAEAVAKAVINGVKKPVTVKIRTGWDTGSINAVEMAKRLEGAGAAAVAIHARTAAQGYSGEADWAIIENAAQALSIPVIGNGDIASPQQAVNRLRNSGCAAVMIGRAALGAPWIFRETNDLLATGVYNSPSRSEMADVILDQIDMMVERYPERIGVKKMRTHMAYYTRGMQNGARFREMVNKAATRDTLRDLTLDFFIENKVTVLV